MPSDHRPDREDLSAQEAALTSARAALGEAAAALADASRREGRAAGPGGDRGMDAVVAEAADLQRVLRSRARRPPAPDTVPLAGAVSAAQRTAARSDAWDAAVREVRDAEAAVDVAALDLAAARGEDV